MCICSVRFVGISDIHSCDGKNKKKQTSRDLSLVEPPSCQSWDHEKVFEAASLW